MPWPAPLARGATITTDHYNSVVAALSSWPAAPNANGNNINNIGAVTFSSNINLLSNNVSVISQVNIGRLSFEALIAVYSGAPFYLANTGDLLIRSNSAKIVLQSGSGIGAITITASNRTLFGNGSDDTVNLIQCFGPFAVYGKSTMYSDSQYQLVIAGITNKNQQLAIGYNIATDMGQIQAVKQGVANVPLQLNPGGGHIFQSLPNFAPVFSAMQPGSIAFWVNETLNLLGIQIKKSNGVGYYGTVTLTAN